MVSYFFYNICYTNKKQIQVKRAPNHVVLVKVLKKREQSYKGKKTNGDICVKYFVTFKFPGRSTKQILVDKIFYDFVNVDDAGTLTYKEHYKNLVYCCFEKDTSLVDD